MAVDTKGTRATPSLTVLLIFFKAVVPSVGVAESILNFTDRLDGFTVCFQ